MGTSVATHAPYAIVTAGGDCPLHDCCADSAQKHFVGLFVVVGLAVVVIGGGTVMVAISFGGTPVVVAGATGTVGRELVRILRRQDVPTVALGRDVLKAKRMLGIKTKCKEVDLSDAETIKAALPVDEPFRLFVATPNGPDQFQLEKTLFDVCAATNRCEHAVKVSTATPVLEARVGPFDAHTKAEALLADSLSHTILRPSLYAQTVFSEHGPLGLPNGAGDGRVREHVLPVAGPIW